jgi:hypothetical protein
VTPPLAPEATAAERLTAGEMSGQEGAQEVVATSSPVNATPVDGTGPLAPAGSAGKDVGSPPGDGGLGSALSEPEALSAPATVLAGNTAQPTPPDPRLLEEVPPPATATLLDRQGVPPSPPELESSLALELPDAASEAAVGTPPRGSGVEPRSTPAERVEAEGSESVASGSGSTAKVTPAAVPRTVAPSSIQFEPAPTPPQVAASERAGAVPAPRKIARTSEDEVIGAALEPVSHVVRRGENFWTISRHYYGSGRYYRALWRANVDTVPKVDELYVGSTILVPPPEHLDREFIDPPARVQRAGSKSTLGRRETDRRQD